jgi:4-hydroxy-tetrahydrodipicolinate reductase
VLAAEGPDDRIELRHDARSRAGFARGAVTAAEWIRGRSGVFTLDDVLEDLFQEDTP